MPLDSTPFREKYQPTAVTDHNYAHDRVSEVNIHWRKTIDKLEIFHFLFRLSHHHPLTLK